MRIGQIQIETINRCNARCVFCPMQYRSVYAVRKDMSRELYVKILHDCQPLNPVQVYPFLNGEPFLDPDMLEKLKLINNILPESTIQIFTNGHLMTPDKIRLLSEIKNIDSINVSVNVCDDIKRLRLMGIPWQQTRDNIEYATQNLNCQITASAVYDVCYINGNDTEIYQNTIKSLAAIPLLFPSGNWAGKIRDCYANYDKCCRPESGMYILADGRAVLCCFDSMGEEVLGDVNTQSLQEIWNSPRLKEIQFLHNQGRRSEVKICSNCTTI